MRKFKLTTIIVSFIILAACFCSCFSRLDSGVEGDPELTLGNLPDYSDAHASDAPYIVFKKVALQTHLHTHLRANSLEVLSLLPTH